MSTSIVLTVIGEDHPGIVESLSEILAEHQGNWTHSSMSSLAGQFAGILLATVPDDNADACIADLEALDSEGLQVIANASGDTAPQETARDFSLDLVGNDRRGIVHDITTVLTRHRVNVLNLETTAEGASMGGGDLFKARADLVVPTSADVEALESELEDIANELMVDITFKT